MRVCQRAVYFSRKGSPSVAQTILRQIHAQARAPTNLSEDFTQWKSIFRGVANRRKNNIALFKVSDITSLNAIQDAAAAEGLTYAPIAASGRELPFFVFPRKWDRYGFFKQRIGDKQVETLQNYFLAICRKKMKLSAKDDSDFARLQIINAKAEKAVLLGERAPYVSWTSYNSYTSGQNISLLDQEVMQLAVDHGKSPYELWDALPMLSKRKNGLYMSKHGFWYRHPNNDICKRVQHILIEELEKIDGKEIFFNDHPNNLSKLKRLFSSSSLHKLRTVTGKWGFSMNELKSLVVQFTHIYPEGHFGWDALGVYVNRPSDEACMRLLGLTDTNGSVDSAILPAFSVLHWDNLIQNSVLLLLLNYSMWSLQRATSANGEERATLRYNALLLEINSILSQLCAEEVLDDSAEQQLHESERIQCACRFTKDTCNKMCENCKTFQDRLRRIPQHKRVHLTFSSEGIRFARVGRPSSSTA